MRIHLLDPASPAWPAEIDSLYRRLPTDDGTRFPVHFVHAVLPHIGGSALTVSDGRGDVVGVGFLLPRSFRRGEGAAHSRYGYTLRYHHLRAGAAITPDALSAQVEQLLAGRGGVHSVVYYDPTQPQDYYATHHKIGSADIGRPNAEEAAAIPRLQQQIWGSSAEFLYPADIHSTAFRLGTTLVARVEGRLAGFLFGFYKFGGAPLPGDWAERFGGDFRIESQTMGVLPEFRGLRLGNLLKREQAELAWQEGIGIVNWTADPLQATNAALNFGLLRAVAFDFYPDYYPFRNALNRVAASRLGLTWLVGSERVAGVDAISARSRVIDLSNAPKSAPEITRVNDGYRSVNLDAGSELIAFEIPADWNSVQANTVEEAMQWRNATDRLLGHYIGRLPGKYVITGAGAAGERRYLIAERVSDALWSRIGRA